MPTTPVVSGPLRCRHLQGWSTAGPASGERLGPWGSIDTPVLCKEIQAVTTVWQRCYLYNTHLPSILGASLQTHNSHTASSYAEAKGSLCHACIACQCPGWNDATWTEDYLEWLTLAWYYHGNNQDCLNSLYCVLIISRYHHTHIWVEMGVHQGSVTHPRFWLLDLWHFCLCQGHSASGWPSAVRTRYLTSKTNQALFPTLNLMPCPLKLAIYFLLLFPSPQRKRTPENHPQREAARLLLSLAQHWSFGWLQSSGICKQMFYFCLWQNRVHISSSRSPSGTLSSRGSSSHHLAVSALSLPEHTRQSCGAGVRCRTGSPGSWLPLRPSGSRPGAWSGSGEDLGSHLFGFSPSPV